VGDRLAAALDRAREVLDILGRGEVHKAIWGSPAGKTHLARRIVAEIPEHRVYVEPFASDWDNEADENVIESVTLSYDYFELVQ